jgi:hypothetical protein
VIFPDRSHVVFNSLKTSPALTKERRWAQATNHSFFATFERGLRDGCLGLRHERRDGVLAPESLRSAGQPDRLGTDHRFGFTADESASSVIMDLAIDAGINFFDTATASWRRSSAGGCSAVVAATTSSSTRRCTRFPQPDRRLFYQAFRGSAPHAGAGSRYISRTISDS